MITPSYLGETIEYSSLHACRSTLEDPTLCVSGAGGKPLGNGGPPEARPGFQGAPSITMGCGACWDETCREKWDVVRGGWADVARRLPAGFLVWIRADISTRVCNLTRVRSERHKCQK